MMTLEYLHPQQAESMYLHHPTASGGFQQQSAHHPPAAPPPHHQFSPADYWQLHGVAAGGEHGAAVTGATVAVTNSAVHHQSNSTGWTSSGLAGAIAASASGAAPVTEWQYIHHASQNSNTVSCPPTSVYTGVSDDYAGSHNQGQAYVSPSGIQSVAQALHRPMMTTYDWMKSSTYRFNPQTGKTRTKDKYRVVYTDHQRLELEKEFHYSRYITIRRKSELALALGLSERQVKIWFQNRRAKERKMAKKIKMQDSQQSQQTTHHHEERVLNERQKEFSQANQHSHNHHHHHHQHHNHHHTALQHSSSPHHTAVDTKPKLPIITTMSTVSPEVITKATSLTPITTTSPPHLVSQHRTSAIENRALTSSHALNSGGETIESSLAIPITAADVANLVLVSSKNPVLQA